MVKLKIKYSVTFIKCDQGPTWPEIVLTQKCRIKNKSFTRVFKSEQYFKTPWLCGCEESNILFCFPCLLFGGGAGIGGENARTDTGVVDLAHLTMKVKLINSSIINSISDFHKKVLDVFARKKDRRIDFLNKKI